MNSPPKVRYDVQLQALERALKLLAAVVGIAIAAAVVFAVL